MPFANTIWLNGGLGAVRVRVDHISVNAGTAVYRTSRPATTVVYGLAARPTQAEGGIYDWITCLDRCGEWMLSNDRYKLRRQAYAD